MSGKNTFPLPNDPIWISKLLNWANHHYPFFAYFTDNGIPYPHQGFKHQFYAAKSAFPLKEATAIYGKQKMVGIIGYDYKNVVEKLTSDHPAPVDCPESVFFLPELEILIEENQISVIHEHADQLLSEILAFAHPLIPNPHVLVTAMTDKETYFSNIQSIKNHIISGDLYEMNYCMGFTFEEKKWDPIQGFEALMKRSAMPFSALFRAEDLYLVCASPERFLKKTGDQWIAQPIKGTIKRGANAEEDSIFQDYLANSEKERAENLMIVDLMRNDLSKVSKVGSVEVEELFGIYAFPKVSQMISTVKSKVRSDLSLETIVQATFPMGSMTGAPKIMCMELIERHEDFKRGWYSGALGYFEADGDFDLNVVIRSIVFDKASGKGYFAVGSAITHDADAEYEYQECLLKSEAIREVLEGF
ncbi:hypothetical protein P872_19970 [Rhodonellum psychrophilum GCM71 = DSM 17998]|uniref:Chorismate-utilising enzyme C-terminal domain-containing protein n=2 Tax=Rhodonellum TaxID=336827 RepID=U5BVP7_9BACT|nr:MULTISPECIES: anthranilate synthase component I family protein [Rhodonellum]ERM81634.1 hypothetical protein P872_19970 [Rhodonellum psychrophilum GCM71 = DSM 17998]SDZ33296.1 para-aminobenzoate synthetase component 1 [Rhodonellum ikkaensis]